MITLMKLDLFNRKSAPSTFLNSLASLRYLLEKFLKTLQEYQSAELSWPSSTWEIGSGENVQKLPRRTKVLTFLILVQLGSYEVKAEQIWLMVLMEVQTSRLLVWVGENSQIYVWYKQTAGLIIRVMLDLLSNIKSSKCKRSFENRKNTAQIFSFISLVVFYIIPYLRNFFVTTKCIFVKICNVPLQKPFGSVCHESPRTPVTHS